MLKVTRRKQKIMTKIKQAFKSLDFSPRQMVILALAGGMLLSSFLGVYQLKTIHAQSIQDRIDALNRENSSNKLKVEKLRDVAVSYEDAIKQLEHDIEKKEKEINLSSQRQEKLKQEIKVAEQELVKQRDLLGQNIRAMYVEGDMSTIEMLASSNDLSEYIDREQYRNSVKNKITETVKTIAELKKKLVAQKKKVDFEIEQQRDRRAELAANRREQNRLLAMNQSQQASFNRDTAKNQEKIKELEAAQAALARSIASGSLVSQGSVTQGQVLGTVGNTGLSFGAHLHFEVRNSSGAAIDPLPYYNGAGGWIKPVEGGFISQYFGNAWDIYSGGSHAGMDIAGVTNQPVVAAAAGEIVRSCRGYCSGYGNHVMIRHANGLYSLYAHMN
jgi:septal ring factor EnvC (AmiA/AmiB activator)